MKQIRIRNIGFLWFFGVLIAFSSITWGAPANNTMLQFTMKAISKDSAYVAYPAQQESPLDVTEEALVTAIARSRTAAYQLQLVIDRKDNEMFPVILKGLPATEQTAKLELFASHLRKAIELMRTAEGNLLTEHAKSDPASRTFLPLANTLGALDKAIKAAHQIFHPHP